MSLQAITQCVCEFVAGPVAQWVAWHLPRRVVEWAVYRFWAHAMTEAFPGRAPEDVTIWQAFDAWDGRVRYRGSPMGERAAGSFRVDPPGYDDRSGGL
jgi:hypothetical protein